MAPMRLVSSLVTRKTGVPCTSSTASTRNRHPSGTRRSAGRLLPCALMLAGVAALTGCETKGWIDPTSVGRWEQEPQVVPILSTLDPGVDEPTPEFLQATDVTAADLVPSSHDYVIGKNDLITISITDLVGPGVETVKSSRVSESGNISLPLVGQVKASGLTEAQLEEAIVAAYRDANIIQNATVSATVAEARNRTFSIIGSVTQPGEYAIVKADFRVLDALVSARDTTVPDLEYLYIIRRNDQGQPATSGKPAAAKETPEVKTGPVIPEPGSPAGAANDAAPSDKPAAAASEKSDAAATTMESQTASPTTPAATGSRVVIGPDGKPMEVGGPAAAPGLTTAAVAATEPAEPFKFAAPEAPTDKRVIKIPLTLLKQGDLRYNAVIRPGDMIVAPSPVIGEYYMAGHVARVGVYSLTNRKITLKMAVASAGMLDGLAIPARTEVVRRVGANKEVYVRVDLDKIFAGEQPDIYLKPNDVVNVGTNAVAPFLAAIRGAFRFTYGFGFLYDRNFADDNNDFNR